MNEHGYLPADLYPLMIVRLASLSHSKTTPHSFYLVLWSMCDSFSACVGLCM
jgi:hypothetical protein